MSVLMMAKCNELPMGQTPKSVLLALADNANDEGFCFPNLDAIAARIGVTKRTVILMVKQLVKYRALEHVSGAAQILQDSYRVTPDSYNAPSESV